MMDSTSTSTNTSGGHKPLIVIVGETASGKSSLGMRLAEEYGGEIIAADSRTVYKFMDVGTAKPTPEDQALVPHHLLDVVEPDKRFSAAQFKELALEAIDDIQRRGKLAIMVGGTGLYVDSVLFDYQFADKADEVQRSELETLTDEQLAEKVVAMDGVEVNLKNRRHMVRYIETGGTPKQELKLRDNTIVIGIRRSRTNLRKRIQDRVEQMFRAGLRKEIEDLVERYGWENEAMTGIVYKLFKKYEEGEISMGEVKRQFVQKDLLLAKRQRTWFKRNPHIEWFDDVEEAYNFLISVVEMST